MTKLLLFLGCGAAGLLLGSSLTTRLVAEQAAVGGNANAKCGTVIDCAQVAVGLAYKMQDSMDKAIPGGAIMAFNKPECPAGWHGFPMLEGRVIVGTGKGPGPDDMIFGHSDGEQKHTQTIVEMPAHNHTNGGYTRLLQPGPHRTAVTWDDTPNETDIVDSADEKTVGGGQAFNVMQPYYVLTYCERDG
ncbi:hypothetical protein ACU8MW_08100 [Rhizobium leguminosarum]